MHTVDPLGSPEPSSQSTASRAMSAVIFDWGGVLTPPVSDALLLWLAEEDIDRDHFAKVMGQLHAQPPEINLIARLERGDIEPREFEQAMSKALDERGFQISHDNLIERMLRGLEQRDHDTFALTHALKLHGYQVGLLSNSWGHQYDRSGWDVFDSVIISGEVRMRKPETRIFELSARDLDVPLSECVMVDDLEHNVDAARELGMAAVLHTDAASTKHQLEQLLGIDLG